MVEFSALLQSSLNGRRVTSADPRWSLNESRLDLMPTSRHPLSLSLSLSFFAGPLEPSANHFYCGENCLSHPRSLFPPKSFLASQLPMPLVSPDRR